jgi:protein tyrosine phosphatase (PTP) superfamily phosphohydrolase (DUF442 family)
MPWISMVAVLGPLTFGGCCHHDKPCNACNTCGPRPAAGAIYTPPPGPAPASSQIVPALPPGAVPASPQVDTRRYYTAPTPPSGASLSIPSWGAPANDQTSPPPEAPKQSPVKPEVKSESSGGSSALPVGIPQFAIAKSKVASGLKPDPDGLTWLAEKGYRAVLHIRQPGDDNSAHRNLIEMRGLKYLTMEVSADTLNKDTVEQFNRLVADTDNLPLLVYDKDGMLAGGLWYLHFRTVEVLSEDEARVKAARLGLKADPEGAHKAMWQAIQRYSTGKPKDGE